MVLLYICLPSLQLKIYAQELSIRIVTGHNRLLVYVFGCKDQNKYAQTRKVIDITRQTQRHKIFNVENPKKGKTMGVHRPQEQITMKREEERGSTIRDLEATTLSSSSSGDDYRVAHSFSLSLSLRTSYRGHYHTNNLTMIYATQYYSFPQLHIYLYNFLVIYIHSPQGHIQAIYNYNLSNQS